MNYDYYYILIKCYIKLFDNVTILNEAYVHIFP